MKEKIKVGFCVAYDWELLEHALPCIYLEADEIWLSIDCERKTWTGREYAWDQLAFQRLIKSIDVSNKIRIYEEDFHLPELTASQNEVRQRNRLAEKMGNGGWHIQLDCDEYFINFSDFVKYLWSLKRKKHRYNVCCPLLTLFKQVQGGFLYVMPIQKDRIEYIQIATLTPYYQYGRRNGDFNVYTNFLIVHQSWARSESEIQQKIENWGHSTDFNQVEFLNQWKQLDASNYQQLSNFHPIAPQVWSQLKLNKSTTIREFLRDFNQAEFPVYTKWQLTLKNSLIFSRLSKVWKLVFRSLVWI